MTELRRIVESAKDSADRTKYKEAIKFALKNKIRHVLFYMDDRECRNLTDLECNEKLAKQDKLVIHHVFNRRVLHKGTPASDLLIRGFSGLINKDYSLRLAAKINKGCEYKASIGWYPHCAIPKGYVHKRETNSSGRESRRGMTTIVRDPNEQNVKQVQREFELRSLGYSVLDIVKMIKSEGYIPANKLKHYRHNTVEGRLKNKFYWGYFDWQGIEYKGKHELIIPAPILRKVKESFEGKVLNFDRHKHLNGWLRCADSECTMAVIYDPKTKVIKSTGERKTFHYYRCSNSRKVHKSLKHISEENLFTQLAPAIEETSLTFDLADEIKKAVRVVHEQSKQAIKDRASEFRDILKRSEDREDIAYQDLKLGILDEEGYRRQIKKIRSERSHYEHQLESANLTINDTVLDSVDRLVELLTNSRSLLIPMNKAKVTAHLKSICSNCSISLTNTSLTATYHLRSSVAAIRNLKAAEVGSELWWSRRELN